MVTIPLRCSEKPGLHEARSFDRLHEVDDEILPLLTALAQAPCPFGPVAANRPLALYGAGDMGGMARDVLRTAGMDFVIAFDIDAARLKNDPNWSDLRLLRPADAPQSIRNSLRVAVAITALPYVPIEQSLLELGFGDIVPFYDLAQTLRHLHPLSNGWFAPPFSHLDRDNVATVLARWDDDVSRAHHLQFLAWRRLREEWTFAGAPVLGRNRFFIPEITDVLRDDEILLDGGAHHGAVIDAFVRHTNRNFRGIVAVEPDPASRATLQDALQSQLPGDQRVAVLDCALAEREGHAPFRDGLGYASQLSDTGRTNVTLRTIDGLGVSPTFIKLHLEGGELAALEGARQTLLSQRPIVAVTVYHNADGIWRTPLWLMETLPDYRLLFRLHSWCGTGAVVYAIPNERSSSS